MADQLRPAFVSAAEAGKACDLPTQGVLTFLATGDQTGGALTAFESRAVPPAAGPPYHLHAREDEAIYVLGGRLRVRLKDAVHEAPAGSFVFIPSGFPHAWQNAGETPARFLVVFTPAAPGMEQFFERAAELPADTRAAGAFGDFAGEAGMTVLGPPLAQSHPPLKRSNDSEADQAAPAAAHVTVE
jgi:quercetin dioxygenase-like cupin family protein